MDHKWPQPAPHCGEASEHLKKMHLLHLARIYRQILNSEKKKQFELKVLAEKIFKSSKAGYGDSVKNWFINNRMGQFKSQINEFVNSPRFGENLVYATECTKFDRHGYKPRDRILLLGDKSLFLIDSKTMKEKHRIQLSQILQVVVTKEKDGLMLVKIPPELKKDKGDLILNIHSVIECAIWFIEASKQNYITIVDAQS